MQDLATGAAGGPAENITAGKPADQSVTNDNAARNFFAVEHGFEPLSPLAQGLLGTNDGNTPGPTPSPTPAPTQTPSVVEPMPGPGPLTDPADMPYGGTYEEQSRAIAGSGMDPWEQRDKQGQLDIVFGKSQPAAKVQTQLEIDNAAKLKEKTDKINTLNDQANFYEIKGYSDEANRCRSEADRLKGEFGANFQGLDGNTLDPKKIADVKLNNKDIGNVRYENGVATGNLDDIVKGFGGRIEWNGQKNATVYDADGNVVSKILNTAQGLMECDQYGRIVKKCGMDGDSVLADVAEYAEKMGVPYSYYHDENGVYHAYAQPEMRGAPIQVTRKEDQIYIKAYIQFNSTGKTPNPAEVQKAYDAIMSTWDTAKTGRDYELNGSNAANNSSKVKLHTTIYASSNCGLTFEGGVPAGQKAVTINLDKDSVMTKQFNWASHVFTQDLKDPAFIKGLLDTAGDITSPVRALPAIGKWLITGDSGNVVENNLFDAVKTGQYEKLLYNWSIQNPGQMWLYNPDDAAHEFGHLLGLGDAYAAFYRGNYEADKEFEWEDEFGNKALYSVPTGMDDQGNPHKDAHGNLIDDADIMRGGSPGPLKVSDTSVALLTNLIWRSGSPYYYEKDTYIK